MRHPSFARARVVGRRLAFSRESSGLVKAYSLKLKGGARVDSVYETEVRKAPKL